ncbi:MAG: proline dehydrogenase family protein, partial [Pseudomonadota bacterium]|nr:proline dehydrogenase family protein [Pseudomonadota bacterium]
MPDAAGPLASAVNFDLGFGLHAGDVRAERAALRAAYRKPEEEVMRALIAEARLQPERLADIQVAATRLAEAVRAARLRAGGVDALMHEFSLNTDEGIALMCLAEALLRIPDAATRDLLIRDKVGGAHWRSHIGTSPSLFVNAAAWGLLITGTLVESHSHNRLEQAMASVLRRGGEPMIRAGVDMAMRLLGRQFVSGRTIEEALANAREREGRGYTFSFDMLGEAAVTADDAARYFAAYEIALHAIGRASAGRGVHGGPGMSVKLSALHPRYTRAQLGRVSRELYPRLLELALLAARHDVGFSIDAEEADRLDLSLDVFARLALEPSLSRWEGLGFVVQAYQKRARLVIDWLGRLAHERGRRINVRLVKGAYWDTEIKRAQVEGVADYPVFTR